jgi:flagellar protein FlaI
MSSEEGADRGLGAPGVDPSDPSDVAEQVGIAGAIAAHLNASQGASTPDATLEVGDGRTAVATVPGALLTRLDSASAPGDLDVETTLAAATTGAVSLQRSATTERVAAAGSGAVNLARTVDHVTDEEFKIDLPAPRPTAMPDEESITERLVRATDRAAELEEFLDHRTISVNPELDEDRFFSTESGTTTIVNRYDMEKTVPESKKRHFREVERYWVNEPFAFVIIFHSQKENEKKYYVVEPHLNEIEENLVEFLSGKLRMAIKYSDDKIQMEGDIEERRDVIRNEARKLLNRYGLYDGPEGSDGTGLVEEMLGLGEDEDPAAAREVGGVPARPEPAVLADDPRSLDDYQVEKVLYQLTRNFIGYAKIDGIKNDINVEDISCDGYNSRVFVYHTNYENIITNIEHGKETLDDFVVKLAQRSGKGISKRQPQVDATLPDGSRAQLTLGRDVSDHGTNYTIRQFKDIPFTPVDLINWNTFSLDEMAFLWLCIENNKSLLFAGGTASGKTTSLNAVSLFIPSNTKIVSIEDTREVKLPQRNWVASVTRPSFAEEGTGDIDEFDLLEAALRQRPEYIVFGEVRGEEGRYLFQVMSTGHTTYTTFHADSVAEVLRRFTTDPINVSKTMFTALDLVSIQTQTRVGGHKVRRNRNITEINHYDAENDEINVQDVFQWQAETDEYLKMGASNTLQEMRFDRGWTQQEIDDEMFKRKVVLAYLINNGLNNYAQVAATVQAFINDDETTLALMANNRLAESLDDLREMESVDIGVAAEQEAIFPRPDPSEDLRRETQGLLDEAEERLFDEFSGLEGEDLSTIIEGMEAASDVTVSSEGEPEAEPVTTDGGIPSEEE